MNGKALLGALVGGVIGAFLWYLAVEITDKRLGYVAIGVGALVGYGSKLLGGKGTGDGIVAGMVALVAMLGGSILLTYAAKAEIIDKEIDGGIEGLEASIWQGVEENYAQHQFAAKEYHAELANGDLDDDILSAIALDAGFDKDNDSGISASELAAFKLKIPVFEQFGPEGDGIALEAFKKKQEPRVAELLKSAREEADEFVDDKRETSEKLEFVADPWDFLFWGIGAFAAFGILSQSEKKKQSAPTRPRQPRSPRPQNPNATPRPRGPVNPKPEQPEE